MRTKLNSRINVFKRVNKQLCSAMRIIFNFSFCCNHNCDGCKKV